MIDVKDVVLAACVKALKEQNLYDNVQYRNRLQAEIKEIDVQMEYDYFYDLYNKKAKFAKNENNLLVAKLLGLVDDFDIEKEATFTQGEFPDIDIDYIPMVRDYLKNDWAPKKFGIENVCAIGNYTTFGIKSSLIDMARVHNRSRQEILELTTKIGLKDEDGKTFTWQKALEQYPDLKKYCEANPDVADSASRLMNRNRGSGMHAGGLIISNQRIDSLVPLIRGKDGVHASAFVEGLSGTDLGPLGLIKFDLLVITNLVQIAKACKIIKDRHGITSICALPGKSDWSDTSYLEDPESLKLANEGKLKCIFQFDSEGIREMVRKGGVTCFEDIVAFAALYRPGPLGMKMDERFIERKRGRESYELHPLLQPILSNTYGVLVYQEQIMKILRAVGLIPDIHCEIVRKAISKKKVKIFARYKEMFIKNGQITLGWTLEQVNDLWNQIEAFAEYGFNKSMTAGTLIPTVAGDKKIEDFVAGDMVYCVDESGKTVETEVIALHDHGELEGFEVTFDDGYQVTCSANHKFLTENGQISLKEICRTRSYVLCDQHIRSDYAKNKNRWMENILQFDFCKQERISLSSNELCNLQRKGTAGEIGEIDNSFSLWAKNVDEQAFDVPSKSLLQLSAVSLEENKIDSCFSLWPGISHLEREGEPFENMQSMRRNKTIEYQKENEQIKSRQSFAREKEDFLGYCSKNLTTTRPVENTSSESKKMARRKSRKICQMHRISTEKCQTISNGNLASKSIILGFRENSMRRRSQTGGFCERQNLDRSGRILSFLRTQEQIRESISIAKSTSKGSDVKRRMFEASECDAVEIKHGMFSFFNGCNEAGNLGLGAGHAPISDTGRLVPRKIVRVVSVGKCHMFDLEVANPTHNFILSNGIVTSNSHSVAYAYISSRLLWLKAHYPLEFFTAILSCEKDHDKIKEYKQEAESMGIKLERIKINQSKVRFDINGDTIYMGFANIKGIGDEVAERIVQHQPYKNFEDFLNRFGTDAKVLKPLIALRTFDDAEPLKLYEYYEYYKQEVKKKEDRNKRNLATLQKYREEFLYLMDEKEKECCEPDYLDELVCLTYTDHPDAENNGKNMLESVCSNPDNVVAMQKIVKKFKKSVESNQQKNDENLICSLDDFEIGGDIDSEIKQLMCEVVQFAESEFYGFSWNHLLESSPDYQGGRTFSDFDEDEAAYVRMCELHIVSQPKVKKSKNGNQYYVSVMEDANSRSHSITFWQEDFDRFRPELEFWQGEVRKGHFVRIRLKRPDPPFKNYTFESPLKQFRWKEVPKDKADDCRLQIMAQPTLLEETVASNLTQDKLIDVESLKTMKIMEF